MGKRKIALYHAFHTSLPIMAGYGFLGLIISGLCLTIFSADYFIIPSMVIILIFLTLKKRKI